MVIDILSGGVRESHHIFTREDVAEILNLQDFRRAADVASGEYAQIGKQFSAAFRSAFARLRKHFANSYTA